MKSAGHKRQDASKKQIGTKILVRNVPFEAKTKEVKELFRYVMSIELVTISCLLNVLCDLRRNRKCNTNHFKLNFFIFFYFEQVY